jgi:hypothetical protein
MDIAMIYFIFYIQPIGNCYDHLAYFVIWYIFPILEFCTKKNLATLLVSHLLHNLVRYKRTKTSMAKLIFSKMFFKLGVDGVFN